MAHHLRIAISDTILYAGSPAWTNHHRIERVRSYFELLDLWESRIVLAQSACMIYHTPRTPTRHEAKWQKEKQTGTSSKNKNLEPQAKPCTKTCRLGWLVSFLFTSSALSFLFPWCTGHCAPALGRLNDFLHIGPECRCWSTEEASAGWGWLCLLTITLRDAVVCLFALSFSSRSCGTISYCRKNKDRTLRLEALKNLLRNIFWNSFSLLLPA